MFVPTRLMAAARSGGAERGKSDPIDALANARAALREQARLPAARLPAQVLEVRRLADHRDDLVTGRTRAVNRLRWLVHNLDPALAPPPRALTRTRGAAARLGAALRALPPSAGRRVALSLLGPSGSESFVSRHVGWGVSRAPCLGGGRSRSPRAAATAARGAGAPPSRAPPAARASKRGGGERRVRPLPFRQPPGAGLVEAGHGEPEGALLSHFRDTGNRNGMTSPSRSSLNRRSWSRAAALVPLGLAVFRVFAR